MSASSARSPATAQRRRPPVRVLTVDDHAPFRDAARALVGVTAGFEVVGESASGRDAIELARELDPDLVIVDVRMTGLDGFDTTRRLLDEDPSRVVVLTSSSDIHGLAAHSARCGAAALVSKQWFCPRLLRGLWIVHRRR